MNQPKIRIWSVFLLLAILSACNDEDPTPSQRITNEKNAYINNWIRERMEFWYLWNNELPASSDINQEPDAFFESLLSDDDRFSWIQEDYQELLNSLKGINKEAGYEFVLYRESEGAQNLIAQVLYVKEGSPAAQAGLLRGDAISHVNNVQLTINNYRDQIAAMQETHTVRYKTPDPVARTFSEEKTASLATVEFAENPNHLHKVLTLGGKKIGYYVYTFFAGGPTDESSDYDVQMDDVFAGFKAEGITDLVLDLRFNSGGTESSARNLASNIGANISANDIFSRREYNSGVEDEIIKDPDLGEAFLKTNFIPKASNVGTMLNGGRVFVLTSSRTASASELVINALKPFMQVYIIGDTTYGKNVGSISIYEENDPKNSWGMQPIVVKVYNSLDQSDYGNGFVPDIVDLDNSLFLYPLGDEREALLSHAIGEITGISSGGRDRVGAEKRNIIGHSLDRKRSSFNLIIDENLKLRELF